ncbi:MAG: PH domain-containing protein [Bacteroidota bacterium]
MSDKAQIIQQAAFNPKLKTYIFWYGFLICLITVVGIFLLPFYLVIAPAYLNVYFKKLECELTTRSLRFKKGNLFQMEKTVPLDKIQDLTFRQGPLLKAFGLSILKIETAGSSVQNGADLSLIGIVDAEAFRQLVLDQRDRVTDNTSTPSGSGNTGDVQNESLVEVLTEIRDSLKRIEQRVVDESA